MVEYIPSVVCRPNVNRHSMGIINPSATTPQCTINTCSGSSFWPNGGGSSESEQANFMTYLKKSSRRHENKELNLNNHIFLYILWHFSLVSHK